MSVVFTTGHSTPLYSSAWTPTTTGSYAGTCIFLVFLAVFSRLLFAWRRKLELEWHDRGVKRKYVVLMGENAALERQSRPLEKPEEGTLTTRGVDESVHVLRASRPGSAIMPWRFSIDLPRAFLFTVHAGVGYLL